jgi:hypothetical protein
MRLQQLQTSYLTENLDYDHIRLVRLWESTGLKLKEAALTADQIQSLFAEIEKGATEAGGNRTALGKGKDAVTAVNKAWEDLKTKIQNSGPIKGFDQKVSDALSKVGMGAADPEFNGQVNKWVQKYRDFAKKHPVAQGAIYATIIALAGITGAGVAGAAALGLLKMADKLLQGERFSSAAYSGAKTGAMAYGASKLGDYLKGKPEGGDGALPAGDMQQGLAADQAFQDRILNKFPPDKGYTFSSSGDSLQVFDANGVKVFTGDIPLKTMDMKTFADLTNNGQMATPGISSGSISSDAMAGVADTEKGFDAMAKARDLRGALRAPDGALDAAGSAASSAGEVAKGAGAEMFKGLASDSMADATIKRIADSIAAGQLSTSDLQHLQASQGFIANALSNADPAKEAALTAHYNLLDKMLRAANEIPVNSSIIRTGKALSEGQVYMIFNRVCARNDQMLSEGKLIEGPMDWIKDKAGQAAGAVAGKAKQIGKNITTKVTADKLNSAWQKAGSPMDSEELKAFLGKQGVSPEVIDNVYKNLKIPAAAAPGAMDIEQVKQLIASLPVDRKARLLKYLTKQPEQKAAAPAAAPAQPAAA